MAASWREQGAALGSNPYIEELNVRQLVSVYSGSRAYGTQVPGSDTDVKAVHIPDVLDIVLQRVAPSLRTGGGDDHESHALHRFMGMVAEGQPVALEMMFASPILWAAEPDPAWLALLHERDRLLTSQTTFRRYAMRQTAKASGGKGLRLSAMQALQETLRTGVAAHGPDARLHAIRTELELLFPLDIQIVASQDGRQEVLQVADRGVPMGNRIGQAIAVLDAALARYGSRVLRTNGEGGTDWKALMHALRLAGEGAEYHLTGAIVLPRPDAAYLRAVRLGQVSLGEVETAIEEAAARYDAAESASVLPETADVAWMEEFVAGHYGTAVAERFQPAAEKAVEGFTRLV
jgi:hypothetical protein